MGSARRKGDLASEYLVDALQATQITRLKLVVDKRLDILKGINMDAIKFVDGTTDRIEGLAIPFGGPADGKDLQGETFTATTDFAADWFTEGRPVLYDHGLDNDAGIRVVGRQTASKIDDNGVWAEVQLNKAHRYAEHISDMVKAGKLYFSSGSIAHLVRKEAGGIIKRWPWVELSLTPTPANPYATVTAKTAEPYFKSLGLELPTALLEPTTDTEKIKNALREVMDEREAAPEPPTQAVDYAFELAKFKANMKIMEAKYDD